MTWFALRVTSPARRDAVLQALFAAGALGVEEIGDSLLTHFPTERGARLAADRVHAEEPGAACRVTDIPDVDWSSAWRDGMRAFTAGALVVAPPWLATNLERGRSIVIEPGMAFGTGDHPSTRGALRLLQQAVRPGDVVADLGSGSAVLAIAAAKLGARRVMAIEIDPDALGNASENVARNGVAETVHLVEGDAAQLLPLLAPVDVVTANILSEVIIGLVPVMQRVLVPSGRAVVAGILETERARVLDALGDAAWRLVAEDSEEEWWSALIERA